MHALSISDRHPSHPRFRYRGTRNPYWKKLSSLSGIQNGVFLDQDAEAQKHHWSTLFKKQLGYAPQKIILELGCNAAQFLLAQAEKFPKKLFLGLDQKSKQIHRAYLKKRKQNLKNIFFLRSLAERLPFLFSKSELDEIWIYFPDPWPKKRTWKKRFLNQLWFQQAWEVLKPNGILHIKTDHKDYFKWILSELNTLSHFFKTLSCTQNLYPTAPLELSLKTHTLFETLFIKEGKPIQSIKLSAQKSPKTF